jgi:hypothetical protein
VGGRNAAVASPTLGERKRSAAIDAEKRTIAA